MKRITIAVLTLIIALTLVPFAAEASVFEWTRPGSNPYTGTIEFAVDKKPLPLQAKQELIEKMKKANISVVRYEEAIKTSDLSIAEKKAILEKAKSRSFLAYEHIEQNLANHQALRDRLLKEIDTSVYEVAHLKAGETCDWMVFGKDTVRSAVVFRPVSGEPEMLGGHLFTVKAEEGVSIQVFQPLACNNLCFRRADLRMRNVTAGAALDRGMPEDATSWQPHLWSWRNSSPEGRAILAQLWNGILGRQSIDIGEQILQAFGEGKIAHYTGACGKSFAIEWFDTDSEEFARGTAWVSTRSGMALITPSGTAVLISACNGWGTFTVQAKPAWARPSMSYMVTAPTGVRLKYPLGHTLWSCGPATKAKCAARALDPTISYRASQVPFVTRLHFVVDD